MSVFIVHSKMYAFKLYIDVYHGVCVIRVSLSLNLWSLDQTVKLNLECFIQWNKKLQNFIRCNFSLLYQHSVYPGFFRCVQSHLRSPSADPMTLPADQCSPIWPLLFLYTTPADSDPLPPVFLFRFPLWDLAGTAADTAKSDAFKNTYHVGAHTLCSL